MCLLREIFFRGVKLKQTRSFRLCILKVALQSLVVALVHDAGVVRIILNRWKGNWLSLEIYRTEITEFMQSDKSFLLEKKIW